MAGKMLNVQKAFTLGLTLCAYVLTLLALVLSGSFTGNVIALESGLNDSSALVFFITGLFGTFILMNYKRQF